jgi:hypothetical protein
VALDRDDLPVLGMSPDGSGEESFYVSRRMLEKLESNGPTWKYEDAAFVEEIMASPAAIFEGLKREGYEEGLCYTGSPASDWTVPDREPVPRVGMVFAIYISGRVILDWDWRKEDDELDGHPEGWRGDFTRKLWPTN